MTTERNIELLRLRPSIQSDPEANPENSPGHFLNATLRPILNLQNELLLQISRNYLQKTKSGFFQLPPAKKLELIANSIRSDLRFRNLLTGVIIGHFTETEWDTFAGYEQELNRRIADLLIQRLSDQMEKLEE